MAKPKKRPSNASRNIQANAKGSSSGTNRSSVQTQTRPAPKDDTALEVGSLNAVPAKRSSQPVGRSRKRVQKRNPLPLVLGVLLLVVLVIGGIVFLSRQTGSQTASGEIPSDPEIIKALSTIDPAVASTVGTGGVQNPLKPTNDGSAVWKGKDNKPIVYYYGAEYCPNCAVERWSMAVALSRFGKFSKLPMTTSASEDSPPSLSTLTFHGSSYSSDYISFNSTEEATNKRASDGNSWEPLETATDEQLTYFKKYSPQGSYPFVDIANQYTLVGASVKPDIITNLSHQQIANQISNSSTDVSKNLLGTANYLTAAICTITGDQPSSICQSDLIKGIKATLKSTGSLPQHGNAGTTAYGTAFDTRRYLS